MKKIDTRTFVREKFSEYYQRQSLEIESPSFIEKREFGFFLFNEKERFMVRHKGFKETSKLRDFMKMIVPSDVYFSCAHYEQPEMEMDEKGWIGADLIFDIDSDHIPTPCAETHDTWACNNCGKIGRGTPLQGCPNCGQRNLNEKKWTCDVCLELAKVELMKLCDFLMRDFGLSQREITLNFSGHRGYHGCVESETVFEFDQMARKEIVDYVVGLGLEPQFHGLEEKKIQRGLPVVKGPDLDDLGWRGRIARGTYELLLEATSEKLKIMGLTTKVSSIIIQHKEALLESWKEKSPWGIVKGIGIENWRRIAQQGAKKQSVRLDTVVTTDIHRLIRLNNTLHGKTGLKKIEFPITDIERFDPFRSAVAFKEGMVCVFVSQAPMFRLGEEVFGPYQNQKIDLPTAAALLLLCKGMAKLGE